MWALKELGVRRIVAPIVCGSLHLDFELGDIVACDQFVDGRVFAIEQVPD